MICIGNRRNYLKARWGKFIYRTSKTEAIESALHEAEQALVQYKKHVQKVET